MFGGQIKVARLGDSIMWGQGLFEDNKWSSLFRRWLQQATGAPVDIGVFTHSGARMDAAAAPMLHGEVPFPSPSIPSLAREIASDAAYAQSLDLIVVNGGINDIGLECILNPFQDADELRALARLYCFERMEQVLNILYDACPNTRIILLGYFPLVSDETPLTAVAKLLVGLVGALLPAPDPWARVAAVALGQAGILKRNMVRNAAAFAEAANTAYQQAAAALNQRAQLANRVRQPVAIYADLGWRPEYGYGTRSTRVWSLDNPVWPGSPLVMWESDDELFRFRTRRGRGAPCADADPYLDISRKVICRIAGTGHPNHLGSATLASAVQAAYEPFLTDVLPPPPPWRDSDVTALTGAPAADSAPMGWVWPSENTQHITYRAGDGHIHDLWMSPEAAWGDTDVTAATGAPAADGAPMGWVWPSENTQHITYRAGDGHIHDLWVAR